MTNQSESIGNLAAALVEAQSQFPSIPKTKTVTVHTQQKGSYDFRYAPLDEILRHVRPVLNKCGLAIMQGMDEDRLTTTLLHSSGEWKSHSMSLQDLPNPQQFGSVMTYKRRYSIKAILGIETDDDDEGAAAVPDQKVKATPNADPFSDVPKERHESLRRVAYSIIDCFNNDPPMENEAHKAWVEVTDNAEKLCVWKVLQPHAAMRKRLKTMDQEARNGV